MFSFRPFMTILLSEKCGLVCTNPKKAEQRWRKHCEAEAGVVEENEGQNWIDHHTEQEYLYDTLATLKKGTEGYEEVLEKLCSETSAYTRCHEEVGWGTEL